VRRGFLQKVIGWVKAVDGVDFAIDEGKTLGLVGESGCGKSTIGRLILRLLEPIRGASFTKAGTLLLSHRRKWLPSGKKCRSSSQDPFGSLNPRMTVRPVDRRGAENDKGQESLGTERQGRKASDMVGMAASAASRYPHEFSGGQRQRIGIARALSVEPSLIICDEPVSALDVSIQAQIINLLKELQSGLGLSYLFISHDLHVVSYISDRVAVMYLGHIMEYAPTEELFDRPLHPYHSRAPLGRSAPGKESSPEGEELAGMCHSLQSPARLQISGRCPLWRTFAGKAKSRCIPWIPNMSCAAGKWSTRGKNRPKEQRRMNPFPDKALISAEGLTRIYSLGTTEIVGIQDIDLEIPKGEMVVLKGVSGSGKSHAFSPF